MSAVVIKVEDVSFGYQQNAVLENFNLNIIKGEFLGITGHNGSGKTTLLKLILGLLTPTQGIIELKTKKIGYIGQRFPELFSYFPLSIGEVVTMGSNLRIDSASCRHALEKVGLWEKVTSKMSQLSPGQQQRVLIARALVNKPEVLILDEPTTGIDQQSEQAFFDLLLNLNHKSSKTIVLVSHDLEVVAKYCDREVKL